MVTLNDRIEKLKLDTPFKQKLDVYMQNMDNKTTDINNRIVSDNKIFNNNITNIHEHKYHISQLNNIIKEYQLKLQSNKTDIVSNEKIIENDIKKDKIVSAEILVLTFIAIFLFFIILFIIHRIFIKFTN